MRSLASGRGSDADELVALARYAAGNLPNDSRLSPCADLDGLPEASFQRLDAWRALAAMLLTNEGNWRTRFSKLEGFPSFAAAAPFKQRIVTLTDGCDQTKRFDKRCMSCVVCRRRISRRLNGKCSSRSWRCCRAPLPS